MKNNLFITLILTLILSSSITAQEIEVHFGEPIKLSRVERISSIQQSEGEILTMITKSNLLSRQNYILKRFNSDLELTNTSEVNLPDRDLDYHAHFFINGQTYYFFKKLDKRNDLHTLYGTVLSENGEFKNDILELMSIKVEKRRDFNLFSINVSTDSTKFFISNTTLPKKAKKSDEKGEVHFLIIDNNFKEIDNVKLKTTHKSGDFTIKSMILDKKGNIHMVASVVINEERKSLFGGINRDYEAKLLTLYKGENTIQDYDLKLDDEDVNYISQIQLKEDKDGLIRMFGFYSNTKSNRTTLSGVFALSIDTDKREVVKSESQELTDEFINLFLSDRQIRKKERKSKRKKSNPYDQLYNYYIRDIVLKNDGGFYAIAEYYQLTVTSSTNSQGATTYTHHYRYKDLMVFNITPDNKVEWYSRIPKSQYSMNDEGIHSGIICGLNTDNSLNIIYNDHRDNAHSMNPENLKTMKKLKKSAVVLVHFKDEGDASKIKLYGDRKSKYYFRPSYKLTENSQNNILLYSVGKKRGRFTKVVLP